MPTINVIPFPQPEIRDSLKNTTVVVIDALRATTTILEALTNGAKRIVPVAEPEQAMRLRAQYAPEPVLISGERAGLKIEGFDLGNSPLEYLPDIIGGMNIMMCSTNGTRAIVHASVAQDILIGCYRNMDAIVTRLGEVTSDIHLCASGKLNQFCLEDSVCAGGMIDKLSETRKDLELTDSAHAAVILWNHYKENILGLLKNCEHGRYLESLGMGADLEFCSQLSVSDRIPALKNGIIQ
jgi:2-phosphosulfolactate phosphatase